MRSAFLVFVLLAFAVAACGSGVGGGHDGGGGAGGSSSGGAGDQAVCPQGAACSGVIVCNRLCFANGVSGTQGRHCSGGTYTCDGPCLPN